MEQDPKKLTRAHKVALGVISLACCCVIGISAFALVAPNAVSELTGQQAGQAAEQGQQGQGSESSAEGNSTNGDDGTSGDNSNGGGSSSQNGNGSNGSSSNDGSSKANGSDNSDGSSSSQGSGNGSSNNGQSSSSSGSSDSGSSSKGSEDSGTVTVTVSVSSSAADGRVSGSASPTFEKGATAYDALCATGLSVTARSSQYGIYVSAIGGLAEFEYGGNSGWMYSVNGSAPNVSCGSYVLKDGDRVSWYYVK